MYDKLILCAQIPAKTLAMVRSWSPWTPEPLQSPRARLTSEQTVTLQISLKTVAWGRVLQTFRWPAQSRHHWMPSSATALSLSFPTSLTGRLSCSHKLLLCPWEQTRATWRWELVWTWAWIYVNKSQGWSLCPTPCWMGCWTNNWMRCTCSFWMTTWPDVTPTWATASCMAWCLHHSPAAICREQTLWIPVWKNQQERTVPMKSVIWTPIT